MQTPRRGSDNRQQRAPAGDSPDLFRRLNLEGGTRNFCYKRGTRELGDLRRSSQPARGSAAPPEGARSTPRSPGLPSALPVGCQPRRDVAARNLGDDVAPEEGTVDHPHGFWVPVEFGFLWE